MMKFRTIAITRLLVASTLLFSSCTLDKMMKLAEEQEVKVVPSPLELHGNSVDFTLSANVPQKLLKKNTQYTVDVMYKPTNAEALQVGTISFDGNAPTVSSIEQPFSFPYEERYNRGQVMIKGTATKGSKSKNTDMLPLPDDGGMGIITTSRLVMPAYAESYVAHGFINKEEYEPDNVQFYFRQGSARLQSSQMRSVDAQEMREHIEGRVPTRTITLTGMHSPEGPTSVNQRLANQRPQAVQDMYKDIARRAGYGDSINNLDFVVKPVVNNWTEFKELLAASVKFTDAQKNQVMAVIDGPGDFVSKELKLRTLPFYRRLFTTIYPLLRTSKVEMLKIKPRLTDEEIVVVAKDVAAGRQSADMLNDGQLAYAATMTADMTEREKMYQQAIKKSDQYYSYNNLGNVYYAMGVAEKDVQKRADYFNKAVMQYELSLKRQESPEAYANLAGAKLMLGDRMASDAALKKLGTPSGAIAAGVSAITGYNQILAGSYDAAIQSLSAATANPMVLYNKALAYLLKASKERSTDYSKAMSAFTEAINADESNAYAHYGAAITARRMNDLDAMGMHLSKAVALSPTLKTRAATDLEFNMARDSKQYMDAMQ
jgi:tetratricopeptide (TPR) repeat protein